MNQLNNFNSLITMFYIYTKKLTNINTNMSNLLTNINKPFEFQDMPIMRPVLIDTKNCGLFRSIWPNRFWKIEEDWFYYLDGIQYVIKKGFVFDGATIPIFLRSCISPTGIYFIASLVHDYGNDFGGVTVVVDKQLRNYKHIKKTRKEMDIIFYDISINGNNYGYNIFNKIVYYTIRLTGGKCGKRNSHRKREVVETVETETVETETVETETVETETVETVETVETETVDILMSS